MMPPLAYLAIFAYLPHRLQHFLLASPNSDDPQDINDQTPPSDRHDWDASKIMVRGTSPYV